MYIIYDFYFTIFLPKRIYRFSRSLVQKPCFLFFSLLSWIFPFFAMIVRLFDTVGSFIFLNLNEFQYDYDGCFGILFKLFPCCFLPHSDLFAFLNVSLDTLNFLLFDILLYFCDFISLILEHFYLLLFNFGMMFAG